MKTVHSLCRTPFYWIVAALLAALVWVPVASAQSPTLTTSRVASTNVRAVAAVPDGADEVPEVDLSRDAFELRDEIRVRPADVDVADTAIIFTSHARRTVDVKCIARDHDGNVVGRTRTQVPPRGLRYIRASDFSEGRDFVGHAECKSNRRVTANAVFFGVEITDLFSHSKRRGRAMYHRFPVIATY